MSNINISPEHGFNPSMPICFWCRQGKKDIVLLGRLPKDAKAPRHCVLDYEPCDKNLNEGCLSVASWKSQRKAKELLKLCFSSICEELKDSYIERR